MVDGTLIGIYLILHSLDEDLTITLQRMTGMTLGIKYIFSKMSEIQKRDEWWRDHLLNFYVPKFKNYIPEQTSLIQI